MSEQDTADGWAKLAHHVSARRAELGLGREGVGRAGGPSHETLRRIEHQARPWFSDETLDALDRGLSWRGGTARRIVDGTAGDDPTAWVAVSASAGATETPGRVGRRRNRDPEGMEPLPVSLDAVSPVELAGALISHLTRGAVADRDYDLIDGLYGLIRRRPDGGDDPGGERDDDPAARAAPQRARGAARRALAGAAA